MDAVTLSPSEASAEDGRSHDEDVWIEAEIERLLLQAQVDAEDRPVERSCTPAPDCQVATGDEPVLLQTIRLVLFCRRSAQETCQSIISSRATSQP